MKNIRMEIVTKFPDKNYDMDVMRCRFGPFEFKYHLDPKNDITIQFDFDAWSGTFEKQNGYIYTKITSGEGLCFNDHSISKDYILDILKTGLDPETIDASFMSMATEIVEFDCDIFTTAQTVLYEAPEIVSIAFMDDSAIPLYVSGEVIEAFNNKHS